MKVVAPGTHEFETLSLADPLNPAGPNFDSRRHLSTLTPAAEASFHSPPDKSITWGSDRFGAGVALSTCVRATAELKILNPRQIERRRLMFNNGVARP